MQPYTSDTAERYAIWEAHKHRCLWCREIVEFANLHIDHLIPQAARGRLPELIERYALPMDFEIDDFRNVAPACAKCNLRKHGEEFNPSPELILLFNSVAKLEAEAIRILKRLENDDYKAQLTVLVELGAKTGQLDKDFLRELLATAEKFYKAEPEEVTEAVPLAEEVWLLRSPEKIQLYFKSLNINSDDIFSYDSPEFKAVEDGKPWLLLMHAELVINQAYTDEYLQRVRRILPEALRYVRKKVTPDKRYARTLHSAHLLCRILQAEGIHVVIFAGSCVIDIKGGGDFRMVPLQTLTKDPVQQLDTCYFWLRVPPFKVVDPLSWTDYSDLNSFEKKAIGDFICAEQVNEVVPRVENLASGLAKQQFEEEFHTSLSIEELDKRPVFGRWLNCIRRFGAYRVKPKANASLTYAPCKIIAPDESVENWTAPTIGNQTPKDMIDEWLREHSPGLQA